MDIPPTMIHKAKGIICRCVYIRKCWTPLLHSPMKEVWIEHFLEEDRRVCSKYGGCVIHLHECLFFLIGFCIPFNKFEVVVLNHLLIAYSQLHPIRWAYIKVFQYLCE